MSQPLKSTIFAPIWRWTAFSAVFRTVVVGLAGIASTEDKVQTSISEQRLVCQDSVTAYRITRFFRRSNGRVLYRCPPAQRENRRGFGIQLWIQCLVWDWFLPTELHCVMRSCGHV